MNWVVHDGHKNKRSTNSTWLYIDKVTQIFDGFTFKFNQNKGINWSVFKTYSDEYVYEPTCENFKEMPDEIWNTIFKKLY